MKKRPFLNKGLIGSLVSASLLSAPILADDSARLLRFADIHKDKVTFVHSGDIYVADINSGESTRLTSHEGMETFPKFSRNGEKIAFAGEFNGSRQVYTMNLDGSGLKQITYYNDVGPMPPRGGYDYRVMDWSADDQHVLVRGNRLPWGERMGRPYLVPIDGGLAQPLAVPETGGGMLSPDGKKYLYTPLDREFRTWKRYRGGRAQDVWIYDLENNTSEQLTTHRATDNQPVWVGDKIYFLSDKSGEYEIYIRPQSGQGKEQRLTTDGSIWRFAPVWSPDSKKLVFSDKNQTLWSLEVSNKKLTKLDRSDTNDIQDYSWSPDSRWIAYTKLEDNGYGSIWIANADNGKVNRLTSANTADQEPVFDTQGNYLFFLSNRDYNLSFSSYEFNYLYHQATRVYAAQLNEQAPALYPHESDEVNLSTNNEKKDKEAKDIKVTIDFAGFDSRVIALPGSAGNYSNLQTNGTQVFVLHNQNNQSHLQLIDLKKKDSQKTVAKNIQDYRISDDGKKLLLRRGNDFSIVDAKPKQKFASSKLNLKNLTVKIDPSVEWQQMYVDGWRILRDWFYDPNTHGSDWLQVRKKYQPWVDAAKHRTDLDYVFGEIAGELNAGHVYVNAGDQPTVTRRSHGLLGAEFSQDKSGYFKIDKIFAGENWHEAFRSPLTQPGVKASVGNYVLAINGYSTKEVNNIYQLLEDTQNRTITLTLNTRPSTKGSWTAQVKPIAREQNLRYLDWVNQRAEMVDKLSGGRIGYLHLPNTAVEGNRELFKRFLPQVTKDALIIDDRYNGGGFIPDRMIELLSRKTLNYWKFRGLKPNATPLIAHDGPKAMLINGYSSSGGDALPYYFRKLGLGKLIGTRTWGGLIGISGNPGLADGGLLLAATFRTMDTEGNWVVENVGVSPDIEVIDRPELIHAGKDPSLERAVQELLKDLKENPRKSIEAPNPPTDFR